MELPQIVTTPKTGNELLHVDGNSLGIPLIDFWRWSTSDLVSNVTRGIFAEFIVAQALGVPLDQVRDEWGSYDLLTPHGIRVEVKSAAYVQSWHQRKLSSIQFLVPPTRAWNAKDNTQDVQSRRQADLYVFALLAHKNQATLDPLNVGQWQFFVLPTEVLNSRTRSQHSITLPTLEKLAGSALTYDQLKSKILAVAAQATAKTLRTSSP